MQQDPPCQGPTQDYKGLVSLTSAHGILADVLRGSMVQCQGLIL